MIRVCLCAAVVMAAVAAAMARDVYRPSAAVQVANSKDLSDEQKVSRLKELASADETRMDALWVLYSMAPHEAMQLAVDIFRAKDASHTVKLNMGRFLLARRPANKEGCPKGFAEEFAKYLVETLVADGEKEFCQKLDDISPTAVGEYAYLASDFMGYKGVDFAPFKDARVAAVLIRCLDAPDNVWPKEQGDCIRGKPGESTGRNTARQQIPAALAKLGDARSIEPLKNVLARHADVYERKNAAYALAILMKKDERAVLGRELLAKSDMLPFRFPFGRGLIEAGDDTGVEFLAIQHAAEARRWPSLSEAMYMMSERLTVLKEFKSLKVESFVREALACAPLRAALLFEPGNDSITAVFNRGYSAEELAQAGPQIIIIHCMLLDCIANNRITGVSDDLKLIAARTRNESIRQRTTICLANLAISATQASH